MDGMRKSWKMSSDPLQQEVSTATARRHGPSLVSKAGITSEMGRASISPI
ncbi:unnamed protein product, partial [Amoebophrya sp. A120]|eukprot:GSA120T00001781001.1